MKRILIFTLTIILSLTSFITPITAEEEYLIPNSALFYYSKNFLLMDLDDGTVLFERNGYEKVHPASITKVATLIAALELMEEKGIDPSDTFTFTQEVFNGMATNASIAGFLLGETVTVEDLLYGIIMPSGADATRAISLHLTGDVEALSTQMNKVAERLELKDTYFVNTSGLDDDKHLSTPYDLAKIVQYSLKNNEFLKYYTAITYTTTSTRQHPNGIDFTNMSLKYGKQMSPDLFTGAKSGHTELAERALSSVSMYDGMNLVFISTNAPQEEVQNTNITDAVQTYRYMYNNYNKATILEQNDSLLSIPLKFGNETITISVDKPVTKMLSTEYDLNTLNVVTTPAQESFEAPLKKGTLLATTQIIVDENVVYELQHTAEKDYKVSLGFKILFGFLNFLKVVGILVVLSAIIVFAIRTYNIQKARKRRALRAQKKTTNSRF